MFATAGGLTTRNISIEQTLLPWTGKWNATTESVETQSQRFWPCSIEAWRRDYNEVRPHSPRGQLIGGSRLSARP
jgi:hypothetical protein